MALSCVDSQEPVIDAKEEGGSGSTGAPPGARGRPGSGGPARGSRDGPRHPRREEEDVASSVGSYKGEKEPVGGGKAWQTFDRDLAVWVDVLHEMKIDETAQQDR